jgi:hypothetical protein
VVSACMQGRACKTGALTRSHLGGFHQRHSRGNQSSSARSHLEVLEPPLAAGEPLSAR